MATSNGNTAARYHLVREVIRVDPIPQYEDVCVDQTSARLPNLWAGVGLVRGGAGTALVGPHEEVANLIGEYHQAGFNEFILPGYRHAA